MNIALLTAGVLTFAGAVLLAYLATRQARRIVRMAAIRFSKLSLPTLMFISQEYIPGRGRV